MHSSHDLVHAQWLQIHCQQLPMGDVITQLSNGYP